MHKINHAIKSTLEYSHAQCLMSNTMFTCALFSTVEPQNKEHFGAGIKLICFFREIFLFGRLKFIVGIIMGS